MGYFSVKYDSRVVIYEHKMFIRLATGDPNKSHQGGSGFLEKSQMKATF